jgi:hypothetical protein
MVLPHLYTNFVLEIERSNLLEYKGYSFETIRWSFDND